MSRGVRVVLVGPHASDGLADALERSLDGDVLVGREALSTPGLDCVVCWTDDPETVAALDADAAVLVVGPDDPAMARDALAAGADDYAVADTVAAGPPVLATRVATLVDRDRAWRHVEALASVVSHDLRNPLHVACAYLDIGPDAENVTKVEAALDRIERVAEDALTVARPDVTLQSRENVSLRAAATDAWDRVSPDGATLDAVDDRTVSADAPRLERLLAAVFEDVGDRAVRQMVDGGDPVAVRVGVLPDGFFVADDGPPVPAPAQPRLFQVESPSDDEGTGVRMAVARILAEAHGWDLSLEQDVAVRFVVRGVE